MFHCEKCGLCCKTVGSNEIYRHLADKDGICVYFNKTTNLCTIYEKRPIICKVDEFYDHNFRQTMSRDEYYKLNYAACKLLKKAMECANNDFE